MFPESPDSVVERMDINLSSVNHVISGDIQVKSGKSVDFNNYRVICYTKYVNGDAYAAHRFYMGDGGWATIFNIGDDGKFLIRSIRDIDQFKNDGLESITIAVITKLDEGPINRRYPRVFINDNSPELKAIGAFVATLRVAGVK
jgi:hypothetical protein